MRILITVSVHLLVRPVVRLYVMRFFLNSKHFGRIESRRETRGHERIWPWYKVRGRGEEEEERVRDASNICKLVR